MHPNLNPNTPHTPRTQNRDPMTGAQIALLIGIWALLFALGAIAMV